MASIIDAYHDQKRKPTSIYIKRRIGFINKTTNKSSCKAYLFVRHKEYISSNTSYSNLILDNILLLGSWVETILFKNRHY
jgi:hypothetical protein